MNQKLIKNQASHTGKGNKSAQLDVKVPQETKLLGTEIMKIDYTILFKREGKIGR